MKYLDEYRDPQAARQLLDAIRRVPRAATGRPWTIMEVCGGQTHGLLRYGIDQQLNGCVELIHGPGCPVCVTHQATIDLAQHLARHPNVVLCSFGDMLRVPGSCGSLLDVRAGGGNVRGVYSPLDAVQLSRQQPEKQVVFFAVGFETTAPATALAVRQAAALKLDNFSLLTAHVRVLPAMRAIVQSPHCRIDGFLAAGHVCTITGFAEYDAFCQQTRLPVLVTGFEPLDLLRGILACVRALAAVKPQVINCYDRSAQLHGNASAQSLLRQVFQVSDLPWRGLGTIAAGGLELRPEMAHFDARHKFGLHAEADQGDATLCPSGQILSGQIKPIECPHFGTTCTPSAPLGAPMVSSEGACAAYYRYRGALPVGNTCEDTANAATLIQPRR